MAFSTPDFAVFFAVSLLLYFSTPPRLRYLVLLILSYVFYATSDIRYVLVLFGSTFGNYVLSRAIASAQTPQRKNLYLSSDILFNLFMLLAFKYVDFFQNMFASLLSMLHIPYTSPTLMLILPVGISFYTFQQIAYGVDVYRGRLKVETNFGLYAVFVAFFPHIIAGPIDRGSSLLPQFRRQVPFDAVRVTEGLRLILLGAFKKVVVADRLANFVYPVYTLPQNFNGIVFLVVTIFYAFQLYADFSGYSDMAIGIAKLLGFDIAVNFRQPYFSLSVREFWQRWHISLSNWIRDYLFYPLTRKSLQISKGKYTQATQVAVSVMVMGIVGLWHGANWTFVIWGLLHGIYLGIEGIFRSPKPQDNQSRLRKIFSYGWNWGRTFALVTFAWVFFRANSISDALYIIRHLFSPGEYASTNLLFIVASRRDLLTPVALIVLIVLIDVLDYRWGISLLLNRTPTILRWAIYYAAIIAIFFFGVGFSPTFIYARF